MKVMCCNKDPVQPNKHIFKKQLAALTQRARSSHPGSAIRKQAQHDWNDRSRGLAQDPIGNKWLTWGLNSGPLGVKAHSKSRVHWATVQGQLPAGLSIGRVRGWGWEGKWVPPWRRPRGSSQGRPQHWGFKHTTVLWQDARAWLRVGLE